MTIEEVTRRLQPLTPALVATHFATTPLRAGQSLQIPEERPYDPRQWIDWLLWALIGMSAYLLIEVARHLRNVAQGEGDFLAETSWYWTQLATGPLIAFVILLLFVHINVDLLTGDEAALQVNLRDYPTDLLLVPAFLLGFYGRVTREVLDQLMKRVFAGAWRAANGDFEVVIKGQDARDNEVPSSSPVSFETNPQQAGIQWSATDGTIDSAGLFKPAPVSAPKQVFISAFSPGTNRPVVKTVTVVKHKFKITAVDNPSCLLQPGQKQKLAIDLGTTQEEPDIAWELVPPSPSTVKFEESETKGKKEVVLVVPQDLTAGTVVVKATVAGLARTISCEITSGLTIQAEENGKKLEPKAQVAKGTKVKLTAGNVPTDQSAQVTWKAEPEGALKFDSTTGPEVTATVDATGAAVAEHPQKGKARFEITV